MEFNLALKDCDKCIELDPGFIKGHVRKGHVCIALKNYQKAIESFEKAQAIDSTNQEAVEGYRQVSVAVVAVAADTEAAIAVFVVPVLVVPVLVVPVLVVTVAVVVAVVVELLLLLL